MEVWFYLFIPFILSGLSLFFFKHKVTWWEFILPLIIGVIVIGSMKGIMSSYNTEDTEYMSEHLTEARYYEDWNERVHCRHPKYCYRTETYRYKCGKSYCTGTRQVQYQCGYHHAYDVDYHRERWVSKTNVGHSYRISEKYYKYLVKFFGNEKFQDLHRHYHTNDGDMYKTEFPGEFEKVVAQSYKGTYVNKTQSAKTLFEFRDLDSLELKGLYDYPEVIDRKQNSCLGCGKEANETLRKYNAIIGRKYEVKIFVLVFDNKSVEIAERQMQHWKNGNMNELVVCIDRNGNWAKSFSWCDNKQVEVEANEIFLSHHDMLTKLNLLEEEVERNWKRKDFEKDFDYIVVELSTKQKIWILVILILVSIGTITFSVLNDINVEKK